MSLSHVVELRIDSSSIPLDLRLCSHLATLSRVCPCPCAFTAQHSVTRDMITDSREDLTNSVAAAVKEHKGKFRGLDCNRGTKTVMKRWARVGAESLRSAFCFISAAVRGGVTADGSFFILQNTSQLDE